MLESAGRFPEEIQGSCPHSTNETEKDCVSSAFLQYQQRDTAQERAPWPVTLHLPIHSHFHHGQNITRAVCKLDCSYFHSIGAGVRMRDRKLRYFSDVASKRVIG